MPENLLEQTDQIPAVIQALRSTLGDALLAIYLHGSGASGELQPQSDIDFCAVVDRSMSENQRNDLLMALLQISGRHPSAPGGPRCIEVMVFLLSELSEVRVPTNAEFTYGEWLRDGFEAGEVPMSRSDPEYTLVLAQAHQQARSLFGPCASELLREIPLKHVRGAMRDALPALLDGLRGDERNVLLTLARMWRTARTGEFVTKDAAAAWAIPQMPDHDAAIMDYARKAYLGEIIDKWGDRLRDVQRVAEHLRERVIRYL